MHDSGKRKEQSTGAQTDPSHASAAMELLSPYSLWDLASWLGKGAEKYAPRNWEKGIPFSICVGKLERHLQQMMMGKTDEDHLSAVGFWWHALAHYRKMIKLGLLNPDLNDLPRYEQIINTNAIVEVELGEDFVEFLDLLQWKRISEPKTHWKANYCGWYVSALFEHSTTGEKRYLYLHKDLTFRFSTGKENWHKKGEAPGYFPNYATAAEYLFVYRYKGEYYEQD